MLVLPQASTERLLLPVQDCSNLSLVLNGAHVDSTADAPSLHNRFGNVDDCAVFAAFVVVVPVVASPAAVRSERVSVAHSLPLQETQAALWGRRLYVNGKYEKIPGFVFVA